MATREDGRDGVGHAGCGPQPIRRLRVPCAGNDLFNGLWLGVDRPQERPVRSVRTVVRLPRGVLEVPCNEISAHAVQNRSVEEQRTSGSSLRVAGNFHSVDCEVADTPEVRDRLPLAKGRGYPFQNKSIGGANAREVWMPIEWQHQGIREATWSLQDRSSAARASKDRQSVFAAGNQVDIISHARGAA